MADRTPVMIARDAFHSSRTAESAKAYADAALAANWSESTLKAVADELTHGGFADEAKRVSP